jgi:hypothetical protein
MTIFSITASPGQRWKSFLPGAALIENDVARNSSTAFAVIRSSWLSSGAMLAFPIRSEFNHRR